MPIAKKITIIAIIAMMITVMALVGAGKYLLPAHKPIILNNASQTIVSNALPYAITNTTDVRINGEYWYPKQCINYASKVMYDLNTTTNTTTGTTKTFLSDVVVYNGSKLQAFISVPIIINGTKNAEIMYEVFCNNNASTIYNNTKG